MSSKTIHKTTLNSKHEFKINHKRRKFSIAPTEKKKNNHKRIITNNLYLIRGKKRKKKEKEKGEIKKRKIPRTDRVLYRRQRWLVRRQSTWRPHSGTVRAERRSWATGRPAWRSASTPRVPTEAVRTEDALKSPPSISHSASSRGRPPAPSLPSNLRIRRLRRPRHR